MSHNSMVSTLINHLLTNNFTSISADLGEYPKPTKITWHDTGKGFVPDVSAYLNQRGYIFEIETAGSLKSNSHTIDQWKLFSTYSQEHGFVFVITVPKSFKKMASELIASTGVIAEVWTIS